MTKLKLHWQILIAMVIGIGIGLYFQDTEFNSNKLYGLIASFGTIFVRLLKMIIVPLIFTSIITGVASIKDSSRLGRLGIKTLLYYTMTSLFAIIIGLTLTNLIQPGIGVELGSNGSFDASNLKTPGSPAEILIRMVPLNPFNAAASGDMLGIIFFAIFLGISISRLKNQQQSTLSNFFESMFQAIMKMTETIIKFVAPIGVLGLITKVVANSGFEIFTAVGKYMMTIAFGLSIHIFFVLPLFFFLMTKTNPMKHFKAISSAMATAFSTSSSSATLPVTMKCVKENAGVSNETASFVLPMGATVNMDGTALYECAGVIFISQVLGIDLSISQQFTVVITALLASIGAAGIPSAGLVMIFIVTQAVGFRDEDVALIIGTMLAVDRPLDMFRTMVNITSDSIGAAVIAKSEGEKLYPNS
jgi:proton glutamate symport protein